MQHHAFTTRYNGRARVLFNEVNVCLPVTPEEAQTQKVEFKKYIAIWDTGATHSAITKRVVDDLGLQPTEYAKQDMLVENQRTTHISLISHCPIG